MKIVPWNKRVNESNFEKSPYGGFQEQAGASRVLRQYDISLKSLYWKLAKIHLEIMYKLYLQNESLEIQQDCYLFCTYLFLIVRETNTYFCRI